ncbi:NIBAN protein, partial [Amia calva]|nr:NIBAN protein [Amia calva]
MGILQSGHLDARQRKHLAGHVEAVLKEFAAHYRRQFAASLLERVRDEVEQRESQGTRLLQQPDALPGKEVVVEGTLLQYQDDKWRQRHLSVTKDFAVESRDSKEVYQKGWECKSILILTACQICTSVEEHCHLLDIACQHIPGSWNGRSPFGPCPTDFPLFLHHPYRAPLCLCARSAEGQREWLRVLQSAILHHSTVLQRKENFETRAFVEAVRFYRQERGSYTTGVLMMGSEEEVLSNVIMEDILPALYEQLFPRLIQSKVRKRYGWTQMVSQVYSLVLAQVSAELGSLREEIAQQRPLLERQIRSDLDQIIALQDNIAHRIAEDVSGEIDQCVARLAVPLLSTTFQELAPPLHAGLTGARQLFLDACDDIIRAGCTGQSLQELISPLNMLSRGSARATDCLALLEKMAGRQAGLQESWRIESSRSLMLQAQNSIQQLLDSAVFTFRRLLSLQFNYRLSPAQFNRALQNVHNRVLKQLDHDLTVVQTQLAHNTLLEIVLPVLLKELVPRYKLQDLTKYEQMVFSDYNNLLHIDNIYQGVVKEALVREINGVLKDAGNIDGGWPPGSWDPLGSQLSGSGTMTPSTGSYENVWIATEGSAVDGHHKAPAQECGVKMDAGQCKCGHNGDGMSFVPKVGPVGTPAGHESRPDGDYICLVGAGENWN